MVLIEALKSPSQPSMTQPPIKHKYKHEELSPCSRKSFSTGLVSLVSPIRNKFFHSHHAIYQIFVPTFTSYNFTVPCQLYKSHTSCNTVMYNLAHMRHMVRVLDIYRLSSLFISTFLVHCPIMEGSRASWQVWSILELHIGCMMWPQVMGWQSKCVQCCYSCIMLGWMQVWKCNAFCFAEKERLLFKAGSLPYRFLEPPKTHVTHVDELHCMWFEVWPTFRLDRSGEILGSSKKKLCRL